MPGRRYIESDRIEGTAVYDVNGHHVGSVRRLIVEKATGQVAYLVINFFGIGEDNSDELFLPVVSPRAVLRPARHHRTGLAGRPTLIHLLQ